MRKEQHFSKLVVMGGLFLSACADLDKKLPTPTTMATVEPTQEVESMNLAQKIDFVEREARNNFLTLVSKIQKHEDPIISEVYNRLISLQDQGNIVFFTGIPIFDDSGELNEYPKIPIVCNYYQGRTFSITAFKRTTDFKTVGELNADMSSSSGGRPDKVGTGDHTSRGVEDVITVNSNVYFNNTISPEVTAAAIDGCLNFRKGLLDNYDAFVESSPQIGIITVEQVWQDHPELVEEADSDAWFDSTRNIIKPYKEVMPDIFSPALYLFDKCNIDIFLHDDPEILEKDRACFRQEYLRSLSDQQVNA